MVKPNPEPQTNLIIQRLIHTLHQISGGREQTIATPSVAFNVKESNACGRCNAAVAVEFVVREVVAAGDDGGDVGAVTCGGA